MTPPPPLGGVLRSGPLRRSGRGYQKIKIKRRPVSRRPTQPPEEPRAKPRDLGIRRARRGEMKTTHTLTGSINLPPPIPTSDHHWVCLRVSFRLRTHLFIYLILRIFLNHKKRLNSFPRRRVDLNNNNNKGSILNQWGGGII